MVQQHTGPQLQLLCVFIVIHARCHASHLGPSLAAAAATTAGGAAAAAAAVRGWPASAPREGVKLTEPMRQSADYRLEFIVLEITELHSWVACRSRRAALRAAWQAAW